MMTECWLYWTIALQQLSLKCFREQWRTLKQTLKEKSQQKDRRHRNKIERLELRNKVIDKKNLPDWSYQKTKEEAESCEPGEVTIIDTTCSENGGGDKLKLNGQL